MILVCLSIWVLLLSRNKQIAENRQAAMPRQQPKRNQYANGFRKLGLYVKQNKRISEKNWTAQRRYPEGRPKTY
jgi:hypothetical protein